MLAMDSGTTVVAHSADSSAMGVAASGHSTFASRIAVGHLKLGALHLHWHPRPVHLRGSEELVRLREEGPNIASPRLPGKWRFPLGILLDFLDLILNHDGLIDHVLEIKVINVE
jgi:hypothetical protein